MLPTGSIHCRRRNSKRSITPRPPVPAVSMRSGQRPQPAITRVRFCKDCDANISHRHHRALFCRECVAIRKKIRRKIYDRRYYLGARKKNARARRRCVDCGDSLASRPKQSTRCADCQKLSTAAVPLKPERRSASTRDVARKRPCIRCREVFASAGFHNRICRACKKQDDAAPAFSLLLPEYMPN